MGGFGSKPRTKVQEKVCLVHIYMYLYIEYTYVFVGT